MTCFLLRLVAGGSRCGGAGDGRGSFAVAAARGVRLARVPLRAVGPGHHARIPKIVRAAAQGRGRAARLAGGGFDQEIRRGACAIAGPA